MVRVAPFFDSRCRMQVWNMLRAARWKCRTQKSSQKSLSGHHRTTLSGYIFATKARIDNRKKDTFPQYGELRPTSDWDPLASLGHFSKFQRISRLGSVTARHSGGERQPNVAALNRGHHLYSAGRLSRWALAHILVVFEIRSTFIKKTMSNTNTKYLKAFTCILPQITQYITQEKVDRFTTFRVRHSRGEIQLILVTRVCFSVCLSLCLSLSHTTARTQTQLGGMVGVPSSCALLGGFAIGARVSLLYDSISRTRNVLYSLYAWLWW